MYDIIYEMFLMFQYKLQYYSTNDMGTARKYFIGSPLDY